MSEAPNEGELLERARRNRKVWIVAGAFAIGMGAGFAAGFHDAARLFDTAEGWPPALAIAIAASYVMVAVGGGILLARHTDEVELKNQYKAVAVGALVYVMAYPVWLVLWMGALMPEPMHLALFAMFIVPMMMASLYYRFR